MYYILVQYIHYVGRKTSQHWFVFLNAWVEPTVNKDSAHCRETLI